MGRLPCGGLPVVPARRGGAAGVLGDLLDRRRVLIAAQSGMLLVAAALAALTFADLTTPASLLALTFTLGLGQALVMPSWQAIQPELVEMREIPQAATLNGVNVNVARAVGPAYVDEMVQLIDDGGPWCVVAPGIALPHARPSALVRRPAAAIVTLLEPVAFGHAHNDPVRVVIALASTTQSEHVRTLAALAVQLDRPGVVDAVAASTTHAEAIAAIEGAGAQP